MIIDHPEAQMLATIVRWAEARPAVRAVLLTSTRAIPGAPLDILSDYDVILVVEALDPFVTDPTWLDAFGEVLVAYWDPVHPDPRYGIAVGSNVIQYADGLKIDFSFWPVALMQQIAAAPELPAEFDAGYRVLLDKDGLTAALPPPTGQAFVPPRPTAAAYRTTINNFLSDAPYVAKFLWRGELMPAKYCLDYVMKHVHLRQMLEWRLEIDHDWTLPVRALGKGLQQHLPAQRWATLEQTYVGADPDDNWTALARTLALMRRVGVEVGDHLGYAYPHALHARVQAYVKEIRRLPPPEHGPEAGGRPASS